MQYLPEGSRLHTPENQAALRSVASMERAMHAGTILEARAVLCDSNLPGAPDGPPNGRRGLRGLTPA